MIDRLSIRTCPPGWPVMYQTWDQLLFLHWPVAAERLRPLIAPQLSLDTFEGRAWVSMTPFTMRGIPAHLPSFASPCEPIARAQRAHVRPFRRRAGGLVLLARRLQHTCGLRGTGGLRAPVLPCSYAVARRICRYPIHLYPHASLGPGGPVRGHVVPRRAAAFATARVVGFLPRRALLPLHRALATALSGAHLPPPVAPLPRRAALLHLDHA